MLTLLSSTENRFYLYILAYTRCYATEEGVAGLVGKVENGPYIGGAVGREREKMEGEK